MILQVARVHILPLGSIHGPQPTTHLNHVSVEEIHWFQIPNPGEIEEIAIV